MKDISKPNATRENLQFRKSIALAMCGRHQADVAGCPFCAISDDSSAQNTSGLSATLKRALNIIEDGAEATGHHQISGIYN